jgi:lipopolysaccharide cholinephosphotransferase
MSKTLTLREIQLSSLDILEKIDNICSKLDIDYFVMYGTLIGAVRHQGFIPWDDDVDIMMPRQDYLKLAEYFRSVNRDATLRLFTVDDEDYPYMIPRVSDVRYEISVENEKHCGMGTFVDIYPIDEISDNLQTSIRTGRYYGMLSSLFFMSTRISYPKTSGFVKNLIKRPAFSLAKLLGKKNLQRKLNIEYEGELRTRYVGCLQWMTSDYRRNVFERELLLGRKRMPFEGIEVNVPENYHQILTDYYGDYMKLPPIELQKPHHLYEARRKTNA